MSAGDRTTDVGAAVRTVEMALKDRPRPRLAVVLGSGLGGFADQVEDPVVLRYGDLPGFPVSAVPGHAGRLVLGTLGSVPVAVMQGRSHLYEGIPATQLAVPVRTLAALGCEAILLTNAAGSLRPDVGPGRLMLVTDHINLTGQNSLTGGPHFVPMGAAYDPALAQQVREAAAAHDVALTEGVYLAVTGPSFETPAEIRAFKVLGADAVGMSTVNEVIAARHAGLKVAAVSAITNLAEGLGDEPLSHEQTLEAAALAAEDLVGVLRQFTEDLQL